MNRRTIGAVVWLVVSIGITAVAISVAALTQLLGSSLPYPAAEDIWRVSSISKADGARDWLLSPGAYFTWREACANCVFAAYRSPTSDAVIGPPGAPRYISTMAVSASFFKMFGASPLMGRFFEEHENLRKTFGRIVVLSEDFWRRDLNADAGIIGRVINIDGFDLQVVGVASRSLWWPERIDLWRPLPLDPSTPRLGNIQQILNVVVRIGPTSRREALESSMTAASAAWKEPNLFRLGIVPLQESWYGPMWTTVNWLVFALLVMIVSSFINLALLGIHVRRTNVVRIAITQALGASTNQSVRPFLVVYAFAIVAAVPFGFVLASAVLAMVEGTGTISAPQFTVATVQVVISGLVAAALSMLLLLLVTTRGIGRLGVADALRSTSGTRLSSVPTKIIAFVQCFVAVVIAAVAVMSIFTARAQATRRLGFQPQNVHAAALSVPFRSYNTLTTLSELEQRFLSEATALGITDLVVTGTIPTVLTGTRSVNVGLDPTVEGPQAFGRSVSPGYFELLGISKIAGRTFSEQDVTQSAPVAVVSRSLASRLGITESSLPVQVKVRPDFGPSRAVVGIVDDVVDYERGGNDHAFYFPFSQVPVLPIFLARRSMSSSMSDVEAALARVDPAITVVKTHSLRERTAAQLRSKTVASVILLLLSVMSTAVMTVGVAVMAKQALLMRTRELAICVALGASPRQAVLRMFANVGIGLSAGIVAGGIASAAILTVVRALIGSTVVVDAGFAILASTGVVALICGLALARAGLLAATIVPSTALNRQ